MAADYVGEIATQYDTQRISAGKWSAEMEIVEDLAAGFEEGSSILDIPLGTGRFLQYYSPVKHSVYGVDISEDMLAQAKPKWEKCGFDEKESRMSVGDASNLEFPDSSIDYVVCIRLLNWVPLTVLSDILGEFKRVSRKQVVVSIREQTPVRAFTFIYAGLRDLVFFPFRLKKHRKSVLRMLYKVALIKRIAERLSGKSIQVGRLTDSGYFVHLDSGVSDVIEKHGFSILKRQLVDSRLNYRSKVIEAYYIYVLDQQN